MKTKINTRCIIVKCFYGINHMLVKDHHYLIGNDTFIMREIATSIKNGTIRATQKHGWISSQFSKFYAIKKIA